MAKENRILLVDDSKVERIYLCSLIDKLEGVVCDEASSFGEALALLSDNEYSILLIDEYMTEGNCFELMSEIRKDEGICDRYGFAVAMGDEEDFRDHVKMKESGFINYIEKPVRFNMLKAAVTMYSSN